MVTYVWKPNIFHALEQRGDTGLVFIVDISLGLKIAMFQYRHSSLQEQKNRNAKLFSSSQVVQQRLRSTQTINAESNVPSAAGGITFTKAK
jgi:hypothetical protein